ncbi:unnamed protein product [Dicrocoelium dendriticum]|nr:unnamed protein product [Dicrocoelium dendriticum]
MLKGRHNVVKAMRRFRAPVPILKIVSRTMSSTTPSEYTYVIDTNEALQFCVRCLEKVGVSTTHSKEMSEVLIMGDLRGHYSHGLNRLEMYVQDVEKGICDAHGEPIIERESVSTALINGKNLLGPVVGNFAMKTAINKAKHTGIGWVSAYNSNHYGIAGWYSMMAAKNKLIGMSFTNTSPLVFPTRSRKRAVGTNPITVAAPSDTPGDEFVLDMATSAVALGKIEMCRRRGLPIPHGWAADSEGRSTTEPKVAITEGALLPLGGEESTSGYKGSGLAMMVEIFCGILAGASYGPNVRTWMNADRPANLGQGFVAIDPNAFAPDFESRMSDYMKTIRQLPRVNDSLPPLVPGDPERAHISECEHMGGIRYPPVLIESMHRLADRLKVEKLPILKEL